MEDYAKKYFERRKETILVSDNKTATEWGQREFKKWFAQSPTRQLVTLHNSEEQFWCSIQSNRFKDDKTLKYMVLPNDVEFPLGTLITQENGDIWILVRHEPHTLNFDNRYVIYQCKDTISWITENGVLQETPCLLIGSMENALQENFRTWNKLVTPQTNKILKVVMPALDLGRETRVSILGETWRVAEYSKNTPGLYFVTLEEARIKEEDSIIPDIDKFEKVKIIARNFPANIRMNTWSPINAWVEQDGKKLSDKLKFASKSKHLEISGNKVKASMGGNHKVVATYVDDEKVQKELDFVVSSVGEITTYHIEGPSTLSWGDIGTYKLVKYYNTVATEISAEFKLVETSLAKLDAENSTVSVPEYGETGNITIFCTIAGKRIEKNITINSVWG